MQFGSSLSIDGLVLVILGAGMVGFTVFYTFLLSVSAGRTVSLVKWAWFAGLGMTAGLSVYWWLLERTRR